MKLKDLLFVTCLLLPVKSIADECPRSPYVYFADVLEVYDGDTITVNIDLGFHTSRNEEKLRLHEIDAPEVRGKTRKEGLKSRDWLRSVILGKRILLKSIKVKKKSRGKFGRYLAVLYLQDGNNCTNLNNELVKRGLAIHKTY